MNPPQEVIARILGAYRVPFTAIAPAQKGYRNHSFAVDGALNVILYKREPHMLTRIQNANAVGNFAAAHGLPARRTYDPRIIALSSAAHQQYAAIYHYLPGTTIPWEAYTMDHLKSLGKTLSDLHAVLDNFTACSLPQVADESLALNQRMHTYFADPHVARALQQKLRLRVMPADFTTLLHTTKKLPHQQALHMDFVRGNILFTGTTITGILDFEKTAKGHPLYDIARTLAFLLVDCKYKPEAKIRKYFLQSGYQKRGAQNFKDYTVRGHSLLETLVTFFLLHDFYKFLCHNPYEYLTQNKHFMRTRTMLLKRGLIAHA